MPRKSLPTRLAATAALLLAAGVLSAPAASAEPADPAPGAPFVLTVSANPAGTDHDHRTVDVTGTLTRADGTPAAGVPVTDQEVVLFTTWNPWGDPIDPTYTEPRDLGKPVTGADGTFSIPGVAVDHLPGSSLLNVQHGVAITALYDEDGDLGTPEDGVWADTTVTADTRASSVSYQVNRKKVKTTAEDDGFLVLSVRVSDYDDTFELRTAPRDFYVAGAERKLPVTNTSLPRG